MNGEPPRAGPLICAATFLGLGLGGFIDGILLHQVLQWHQMISNWLPPDTLSVSKINMFWDGIFHLGTWTLTMIGLKLLWRLIGRRDVLFSTTVFVGSLLFGWGLFQPDGQRVRSLPVRVPQRARECAEPVGVEPPLPHPLAGSMAIGWMVVQRGRRPAVAAA